MDIGTIYSYLSRAYIAKCLEILQLPCILLTSYFKTEIQSVKHFNIMKLSIQSRYHLMEIHKIPFVQLVMYCLESSLLFQ